MSEAQDRIDGAGRSYEESARHFPPTMEGYALLALLDVVRQVAVEAFEVQETVLEVGVGEVQPELLYRAGEEPVPRHGTDDHNLLDLIRALVMDGGLECDRPKTCECSTARAMRLVGLVP